MKNNKKLVALICVVLLMVGTVGATLAWLMDQSGPVTNTFTTSDIEITLEESDSGQDTDENKDTNSYKMVPGYEIAKDPYVIVATGSEPCWVFVQYTKVGGNVTVTENGQEVNKTWDDFMTFAKAEGWTQGNSKNGVPENVFFRQVLAEDMGKNIYVLEDNEVKVNDTVTKEMMKALGSAYPQLTFKAYAHQLYMDEDKTEFTASAAWVNLNPPANN